MNASGGGRSDEPWEGDFIRGFWGWARKLPDGVTKFHHNTTDKTFRISSDGYIALLTKVPK